MGLSGNAVHLQSSEGTYPSEAVAEAKGCPYIPLKVRDILTVPLIAFSCLSNETVLCRVLHRNLKLYFNSRSPALLTEKVIYFVVSSHII